MPVTFAAEACDELVKFPGVTACLLNVKLIPHPENVPVASGKNVATVGFQCNARVIIVIW
jgi:hypothetical protein